MIVLLTLYYTDTGLLKKIIIMIYVYKRLIGPNVQIVIYGGPYPKSTIEYSRRPKFSYPADFGQQQIHKRKESVWFFPTWFSGMNLCNQWREYSKRTLWQEVGMSFSFYLDAIQGSFTHHLSKTMTKTVYKLDTLFLILFFNAYRTRFKDHLKPGQRSMRSKPRS